MEALSHNKYRLKVQSMRTAINRARVQLVRKLIADIKKVSNKKITDKMQKGKNDRKLERLTEETHILRHMKQKLIAEFALSHSWETAENLRDNPVVTSKERVLAKISLHKLVKPLVDEFQQKFPDWKEKLPKILAKEPLTSNNVEPEDTIMPSGNDLNEKFPFSEDEDEKESSSDESMDTEGSSSDDELSKIGRKQVYKKDDFKSSGDSEMGNEIFRTASNQKRLTNNYIQNSLEEIKFDNKCPEKTSKFKKVSYSNKKLVSKKSDQFTVTPLKIQLPPKMSLSPKVISPRNQWIVESIADDDCNLGKVEGEKKLSNSTEMKLNDKKDVKPNQDKKSLSKSSREINDSIKVEQQNKKIKSLGKKPLHNGKINSEERKKKSISKTELVNRNLDSDYIDDDLKNEKIVKHAEVRKVIKRPHEDNNDEDSNVMKLPKSSDPSDMLFPKQEKEMRSESNESDKAKQQADPFFLTKDDQQYMTFGKIVEENNEIPFLKTSKLKLDKTWNNNQQISKIEHEGNTTIGGERQKNNRFEKGNRKHSSEHGVGIILHPSWEAKKKSSLILPFQGKKLAFEDD